MEIFVNVNEICMVCSSFSGAQNYAHNNEGSIEYSEVFKYFKEEAIASLMNISMAKFNLKIKENAFNNRECEIMEEMFFFLYRLESKNML